ncbi:MAG: 16S rRNA methyltransferase [Chloroflexota bacterium]
MIDDVAAEVLRSRRYRWIAPDLVRRLVREEVPRSRNRADTVKRTKRRLHQSFGAYVWDIRPDEALAQLRAARDTGDEARLRDACREILSRHASTRERLPVLDRFYPEVFQITGAPQVLIDVACGLGPLALPWMSLPPGASYLAFDIDRRLIELVDGFLDLCGVPHLTEVRDVAAQPPATPADVALLLKTAPCLEQQHAGSARRLIAALHARHIVLSFPTRSLGGASKGMVEHYRDQLTTMVVGSDWRITELLFPPELVYVLTRRPQEEA